jgi:hypothetical protein
MQPETADRWLDAWVLEAATRDLPRDGAYWYVGYAWIAAEQAAHRPGCWFIEGRWGPAQARKGEAMQAAVPVSAFPAPEADTIRSLLRVGAIALALVGLT